MSYELCDAEKINLLLNQVSKMSEQITHLSQKVEFGNNKMIYTNKEIMNLLGIGAKLIKFYRDKGLLGYHQQGDKYWYSQTDIDQFMGKNYFPAYS